jgi:hypothetical protein
MSRSLHIVSVCFTALAILLITQLLYLSFFGSCEKKRLQQKYSFVAFVGLPDLAVSKKPYLRHRSLSGVFDIYSMDGALREYDKESFLLSKGVR